MQKFAKYTFAALAAFALVSVPALAQGYPEGTTPEQAATIAQSGSMGWGYLGAAVGAGIAILGAGLGIGRLAGSALEGMARQPEAAGPIRAAMILAAALIEGATFFALVICILIAVK